MHSILTVAKYEYLKTVKRKAFWFTTLFFPIFMGALIFLSAASSIEGGKLLEEISSQIKTVHIIDDAGAVPHANLPEPFFIGESLDKSKELVKTGEIDGLIYFPANVTEDGVYEIYAPDRGLLGNVSLSAAAQALVQQNIISSIPDPKLQKLSTLQLQETLFLFNKGGELQQFGVEKFVIPLASAAIFFLSVFISAQYMLQSVAEEKENRMIENLLSIISSKTLIFGKLFGLSGAVLTQLFIWLGGVALIVVIAVNNNSLAIPFDASKVPFHQLPINILFTFAGFFLFSAIMTGVGAVSTSYKDSQSLSAVFIIMSMLPLYFITILLGDPNGTIANVASVFPLTSPMVYVIRNSISEMPPDEIVIGLVLNLAYVLIAFWIALKLFNLGSLMFERKPKLKEIWHILRKS